MCVCVCVCVFVCVYTRLFLSCNLDSNVCPIPFQTRPGVVTLSSELTSITSPPRPVMEHLSLALSIRGYSGGIMEKWPIRQVVLNLSLREIQKRRRISFHTLIHFIYVYIHIYVRVHKSLRLYVRNVYVVKNRLHFLSFF